MTATTTRTVTLADIGPVDVAVSEYGDGQPFLLLHGGGGPDTVTGFAELFAEDPRRPGHRAHPSRLRRHRPARAP